ncbi:alpha-tocopherol transfer protein-like isoform X1 [Lycorma delicatula]|uniref:alpha-tocopherol transfer protein-like isoform X1 n=1 Tax=Lycorma delicatula TaxID=130591 RepID=UPI003F50FEB2
MTSRLEDLIPIKIDDQYKKCEKLKPEEVAELRQWFLSRPNYPHHVPDVILALFLHSSDYNIADAKKYCDTSLKLRSDTPEMFSNRDPHNPEIKRVNELVDMWISPKTTPDNYHILYAGFINTDPSTYDFAEACKRFLMVGEAFVLKNGIIPGLIVVLDAKGGSYRHVLKAKLAHIRKFLIYVQEALPIKINQVHIININPVIDKIMYIIRPFIKATLMENIHFHSGISGLSKYIPKDTLPTDLGGYTGTRKENQCKTDAMLEDMRAWFMQDNLRLQNNEKSKSNENQSITHFQESNSSFHSLDID